MSTQTFQRLLYTDCRPGQGLGGGGGYQVQAQSTGCSSSQARMAIRWLLYATQTTWVNTDRPVEEFPRGLSHSADAGFGTGQSRYLGKEVNGNRQGNYIADCILTDHVEPYGVIRPAQLWQAPFWREEIWPSTTAPVLNDLDIGPLDTDAIADWLHEDPTRVPALARLLTVLEDGGGNRVVIRADNPESALYWIAASTVLLPMREALSVSFQVFANNIDVPHRVVAVPRDLHPNLMPGSRPKTFLIDATTGATDDIEPSARAIFWVRRLNEADEPYDVVEAVTLAAAFGGATEQELSDSRHAAMAVVDPSHAIEDAAGVGRWVRRSIGTVHDHAAQSVLSRLISDDDVRIDDLRLLDDLAADGTITVEPSQVRGRLLDAELQRAVSGIAPPAERLRRVVLSKVQRSDSASAVVSAMLIGSDRSMDLLLRVAWRHGLELEPPSPALVDRVRTFIADWLKAPDTSYTVDNWALRDLIIDELHGQLRGVWAERDMSTLARVLRSTILDMVRRPNDVTDAFTVEIEACYAETLKPQRRMQQIRGVVQTLLAVGADKSFVAYQDALVRWHAVDPESCLDIVAQIPTSFNLNDTIITLASREVLSRADTVNEALLGAIEGLYSRNALPDSPRLRKIARSASAIATLLDKLHENHSTSDFGGIVEELRAIRDVDDDVLELSIPALVSVAFTASYGQLGQSLLRFLRDRPARSFCRAWATCVQDPTGGRRAAAYAFTWSGDKHIPSDARRELRHQIVAHYESLPAQDAAWWRSSATEYLRGDEEREAFEELLIGDRNSKPRGPRPRPRGRN